MATGYIKKHRKIEQNTALWNNERAYICFDKLLLFSNRNTGTYISGLKPLSARLGKWSINTTKKALKDLEDLGCIKTERSEAGTKITIIKYLDYQKKRVSKIDTPKAEEEVSDFDTPEGQNLTPPADRGVSKIDIAEGQNLIKPPSKIDTPIYKVVQETTEKLKDKETILMHEVLKNAERDFEIFWDAYKKKMDRKTCWAWWQKNYQKIDFTKLMSGVIWYLASDRVREGYKLDPIRFLKREVWNDDPSGYSKKGGKNNGTDFDKQTEEGKYSGFGRSFGG